MSPDDYLLKTLTKYSLPSGPDAPIHAARDELQALIQAWAKHYLVDVRFSGSYAKCTRIRGGTDFDLLATLSPDSPGSMRQVFSSLFSNLSARKYQPRQQSVSLGVICRGLKADLIPAKQQPAKPREVVIFETERRRETRTNLEFHVNLVRHSGWLDEIRAVKVWRDLHGLRFPSFCLELAALDALRTARKKQPAGNFLLVLEYLRDKFAGMPIRDPANQNNVISDDLMRHEKLAIADKAAETLEEEDWSKIVW